MKPSEVLAIFGVLAVLGAVLWPVNGGDKMAAKGTMCLSKTKGQSLGLIMYASDENDRFPNRDRWMDAAAEYVKGTEDAFRCPEVERPGLGYAFNAVWSEAKLPQTEAVAAATPLVYDSVALFRNVSDRFTSLPHPGRHHGANGVAYADGHARRLTMR